MTASPSFAVVFWPDPSLKTATQIIMRTEVALNILRKPEPYRRCIITITITDVQKKKSHDNDTSVGKVSVLKQ